MRGSKHLWTAQLPPSNLVPSLRSNVEKKKLFPDLKVKIREEVTPYSSRGEKEGTEELERKENLK